jgi:hypothetical protein
MRIAVAILALLVTASAWADFDSGSFDTNSFSNQSFDFGDGTTTVPDVLGLDQAAADTALEAAGLDTGNVTSACSDEAMGDVVSQAPPSGTIVAEGSLVDLVTSSGTPCTGTGGKLRLRLDLRL